jgi:hypothetical protein
MQNHRMLFRNILHHPPVVVLIRTGTFHACAGEMSSYHILNMQKVVAFCLLNIVK